jgi:hypothetical protein
MTNHVTEGFEESCIAEISQSYSNYDLFYKCYEDDNVRYFQEYVGLDDCLVEEESCNKEVELSIQAIDAGKEFAFYNLNLSSKDREVLDSIVITKWNNIILQTAYSNPNVEEEIKNAVLSMDGILATSNQINYLAHLLARLTSVVFGQVDSQNFEIHIRTKKAYEYTYPCIYWHLDKSQGERYGERETFYNNTKGHLH